MQRNHDIFRPLPGQDKAIRTVLTKGVAGIGKTVSVQKFILDWAEGKENQDVQLIFPLPFRELNLMKDKTLSLSGLLNSFFSKTKEKEISIEENKVLFIFDGLDECRLSLDFKSKVKLFIQEPFHHVPHPSVLLDLSRCFVHLSIQEHLAALYVHFSFTIKRRNVFDQTKQSLLPKIFKQKKYNSLSELHQRAVNEALQSKNGHLDLFLRFLLGLSLESNQTLLRKLLPQTGSCSYNKEETVQYIKQKIRENRSPEKSINLFHCLNELGDDSLMKQIQDYLKSGEIRETKLSSSQWSALVYVLLTSEEKMDVFDLKLFVGKQHKADEVLQNLLPVVKESRSVRLCGCDLTAQSCESLSSALQSSNSVLRELDLSNNDLKDSGVKLLSDGLKSTNCQLEILRLSGCMVTEKGCRYVSLALSSNPSHLRELDLSYNHPGDSGVKLLSEKLEDSNCSLDKLDVDYGEECRIKAGLKKWLCFFTLDPNTANTRLILSEQNRKVTNVEQYQLYPDHSGRFDVHLQVLCRESVCGRCYWETEWSGDVYISVSYKSISRKGWGKECWFGCNDQSWSLICSPDSYSFYHNDIETCLPVKPIISSRIGVYVDHSAGTLSFYSISDTTSLIHTVQTTFTQPLYPGFTVHLKSSVKLC
ncbi:protein NLRC3-like [Sinocyclocheilus rhinocerous]|uniref:protein NLRC3-like n=1 Tax=Sinocyclocheilus rhinocerous TaxID=307959 RepID=UPI0007B96CFE|nr:PREDICTED: protein NLRC3-like [Sinocyclocheilus rhinocerous]